MKLKKYNGSRYKGTLITEVILNKDVDGSASIHLMSDRKELYYTPLWIWYDDVKGYSADYLLCDIQDTTGLEVLK